VPSEGKTAYTAGRVLPADPASLLLKGKALNNSMGKLEGDGNLHL